MAAQASGTVIPSVIGTEETVSTVSVDGKYVLMVNTTNLALGDSVELNLYTKPLTGGTSVLFKSATYSHNQSDPIKVSDPVASEFEYIFKINQKAGTARAFPWRIDAL